MRFIRGLQAVLVVGAVFEALWFRSRLPEVVATHFGVGGEANGWMPRDTHLWFSVGMVVFVSAVFTGIPVLIRVLPSSLINIPNRGYWLAPPRREQTIDTIARDVGSIGIVVTSGMLGIFQLVDELAVRGASRLPEATFLALLSATFGGIAFFVVRMLLMFRRPV